MNRVLSMVILVLGVVGPAQATTITIYQDDFGRTGALNGTAPDTRVGLYGGQAGATWTAADAFATDGSQANLSVVAGGDASAWLPFTPQSGYVYTLTAYVRDTSSTESWNHWSFLAFSKGANTATSYQNGLDPFVAAYRQSDTLTGFKDSTFATQKDIGHYSATVPITVVLDTTSTDWTYTMSANGASPMTGTYTGGISGIVAVGVGIRANGTTTGDGTGLVDSFKLTVSGDIRVPEPSTAYMCVTGRMGLLCYAWRRRR
jgi:hypothetical protein